MGHKLHGSGVIVQMRRNVATVRFYGRGEIEVYTRSLYLDENENRWREWGLWALSGLLLIAVIVMSAWLIG